MSNSKTRLISNIFKRFSQIFNSPHNNVVSPETTLETSQPLRKKTSSNFFSKKNKISPFIGSSNEIPLKQQNTSEYIKKKPSVSVKASFMFQSMKQSIPIEENNDFENEFVLEKLENIKKQEKAEILSQLKQILSRDENEEDYKLAKLMKSDADTGLQNEIGIIDLYEQEAEKYEKISEEHSCLYAQKKNPFELIQIYADRYPCLDLRKGLLFLQKLISYYSAIIIKHKMTKYFILMVTFWNSIIMVLEDPSKDLVNPLFLTMENFFLVVYTLEMLLKIFGMGFIFGKRSYMRDPWNVFDLIVNVTSYLPLVITSNVESFKLSSFRILRILRPLRTITFIKTIKVIFLTLAKSIPLLMDILLILCGFILVFAIIGTHLFIDLLKNRCFEPISGIKGASDIFCGYNTCPNSNICGKIIANPFYNVVNFDTIFYSLIMVFQIMTLQAWSSVMFAVAKVFSPWSELYFISIVIFGSFFLINLTLAVIKTKFTDVQKIRMSDLKSKKSLEKSEIDVVELKQFKRMERAHFKRQGLDVEGIGASREIHSKMDELKWDDLFELKERIKEEREREEADQKFREERKENLRNEQKIIFYMKKIEQQKKKSFNIFLNRLSLQKKNQQQPRISNDFRIRAESIGIEAPPQIKKNDEDLQEGLEIENIVKIGENSSLTSSFIDTETLNLIDLKAVSNDKKKLSVNETALNDNRHKSNSNNINIRASAFIDLPNIKEENSSDESNILSLTDTIKSPKSSLLNDSDFNNSFTLKKCKLYEMKETNNNEDNENNGNNGNNEDLNHEQINYISNYKSQVEVSVTKINNVSTRDNANSETPANSPFLTINLNNNFFIGSNLSAPSPINGNNGIIRKSILKNSMNSQNLNFQVKKSEKIEKQLSSNKNKKELERMKSNETPCLNVKINNQNIIYQQKKRENIRFYKLMVDSQKPVISYSKEDVLEHRIEILKQQKIYEEYLKIKNCKYQIVHSLKPAFNNPEVLKYLNSLKKKKRHLPLQIKASNSKTMIEKPLFFRKIDQISRMYYPSSPKLLIRRMRKNTKRPLKPLIDPDFNYNTMKKKIEQKIPVEQTSNLLKNFNHELEYQEIKLEDVEKKTKSKYIWSGQEVLPLRLVKGAWTISKINEILKALSTYSYDKEIWLSGFDGLKRIFFKKTKKLVDSRLFSHLMILIIIANTITLSLGGLVSDSGVQILDILNICFVSIYLFELLLKISSYPIQSYLRDPLNIFDALVSLLGLIDLCINQRVSPANKHVLSIFRVLRVVRILRTLKFMRTIINVIQRSMQSFIYIFLLLSLLLLIYALLGRNLFAGSFDNSKFIYRQNFDSYGNAIIAVFQVLTSTAWQYILQIALNSEINKFISTFYLISWIVIGNYIFLNLFLAIILGEFNKESQASLKSLEDGFEEIELKKTIEIIQKPNVDMNFDKPTTSFYNLANNMNDATPMTPKAENVEDFNKDYLFYRNYCKKFVEHAIFRYFMQIVIASSSVSLILDTYARSADEEMTYFLNITDHILNSIFFIEFFLKIFAFGVFFGKNAYFKSSWNVLDFIVLNTSFFYSLSLFLNSSNQIFKLLKILRLFRFISHNSTMKIVFLALLDSISSIIHVIIVIFFVWLIFAIIGIALLGGRMGYCSGLSNFYGINKQSCLQLNKIWKIANTNFDNIFNAMVTLFILASKEVWIDIMYQCIDSNTDDIGPIKDNYINITYYFFVFIFIGVFFFMNLFIGVISFHFSQAQKNEKNKISIFLTQTQIKWLSIQKMIAQAKPDFFTSYKPKNIFKMVVYNILHNKYFIHSMNFFIVMSLIFLSMKYSGSKTYDYVLEQMNLYINSIFFLELIMKIFVGGLFRFLDYRWNRFDFVINAITFIEILLTNLKILEEGSKMSIFLRIFAVFRIFRLIPLFKGVEKILENLSFAIPSFLNVGGLLLLIFFFYAQLGFFLFSDISKGTIVDDYNNFHNFVSALVTLFKIATADEWFFIMFDLYENKYGGSLTSIIYFFTFVTLCSYIMINIFIIIIIQQFEEYQVDENNPIQTFKENLENFRKIWAEYSASNDSVFINQKNLIDFYMKLEPPLGFGPKTERAKVALELMKMKLDGDEEGNIYFNELLFASMKRIFGPELLSNVSSEIETLLHREEQKIRQRIGKKKSKMSQKHSFIGSFFELSPSRKNSQKNVLRRYSVNPIITILFVGMAMKTWKRFAQRKINGELLSDDSLPCVEEEESYEMLDSPQSISSSKSYSDSSISFESLERNKNRRNAEKNISSSKSLSQSSIENEKNSGSSSSGSSLKSSDEEEMRKNSLKKKRRDRNQSQINLINGFLWNKADGKKDFIRSSNMFVNFLSLHNGNSFGRSATNFKQSQLQQNEENVVQN